MFQVVPKAAVSAILMDGNRLLLVKRGCEPNKGLWSLPGGSIEPGETAREAVAREVAEETSLQVEAGRVAGVRDVIVRDGDLLRFHYVIINFLAHVIGGELKAASDAADARWFEPEELRELPTTEGLLDSLTAVGVL